MPGGNNQVGMTAGADSFVNAPYMTDTQALWEQVVATRPRPKPKKALVTPRMRPSTERVPPRRRQTPGEKAFGIKPPTPKRAPSPKPPKSDRSRRPSQQHAEGGEADASAPSDAAALAAASEAKLVPRAGSPAKRKPKAKTARVARPQPPTLVQPEWDARGPPRRAPGEVVNKYNHRGTLGIAGALTSGGGFDMEGSGAWDGESLAETTTTRPDRITNSPTGKMHPNADRRFELRETDMFNNINYFSPGGAPDNDRKMKESSWISSQAWFESLRYYPKGQEAVDNEDCEATFSGNTHGSTVPAEHIQNDVRNRVGIAPADPGWMPHQCPEPWAPELEARMARMHVSRHLSSATTVPAN